MKALHVLPVATIIVVILAVIGGVETIVHPSVLSFTAYVKYVGTAAGLLGIGRGLDSGGGARP